MKLPIEKFHDRMFKKMGEEMEFTIKDSGKREIYKSGAVRDTNEGKIRWDLLPVECLERLAELYTKGAKKYNDNNWKKGIPTERFIESAWRHWGQFLLGETEEDHLSAVIFNIFGIMFNQTRAGQVIEVTKEELDRIVGGTK